MLERLVLWMEHKTNTLHVLCRLITVLQWYDWVWRRVFCRGVTTKVQLVHQVFLERKRKSVKKKFHELNDNNGE